MICRFLALFIFMIGCLSGATLPITTEEVVSSGLSNPVGVVHIAGDSSRVFVIEQHTGRVRIVTLATGAISATPFLTEAGISTGGEQGLLGIAFHPNYATNGYVYINCTKPGGGGGGHTEIVRYTANAPFASSSTVNVGSRVVVLSFDQPESNHNGGWIGFGNDGYLYISSGDGGGGGDNHGTVGNGQNLNTLLGKILRLNVATQPYSIPTGNMTGSGVRPEIFAFGVRNPWRCSIDRANGNLWIGDVGQNAREEVSFGPAGVGGRNYGWRRYEGFLDYNTGTPLSNGIPHTPPVVDYARGTGVAIVGGNVYRGNAIPSLRGTYFYADYSSRRYFSFTAGAGTATNQQEITTQINPNNRVGNPSSFGEDANGEIYICDRSNGRLHKIISTITSTQVAFISQPSTVNVGAAITPAVQVAIQDASGNTVTSSTAMVSLAIAANPGGATLGGTVSMAAVSGVATFNNLSLNNAGTGYTLRATSTGLTAATSTAFNVQARVATPVITPDGGSYTGPVWVQIASATTGITIRYTTDGSAPNGTSPIYSAPFQITGTRTVRAFATRSGFADSAGVTVTLTINGTTSYGMDTRPLVSGINMPTTVTGTLPPLLSATGIFSTTSTLTAKPGVVPFTVNSPLWSDNAEKNRWVVLPGPGKIGFNSTGEFTWPGGTVLVKHFEIAKIGGGTRRLETRLLVLNASGGNGYGVTYKWRADNTDAELMAASGQDEVLSDVAGGQTWHYPSRDQCLQCHTSNAGFVLGPKTRHLNGNYQYPTGRTDNQLRTWNYLQMFSTRINEATIPNLSKTVLITDTTAPLSTRVRSYLDANCASCHRPGSAIETWDARFDTHIDSQGIINKDLAVSLGITGEKVVVPKDIAKSILHARMLSTDPTRRMPQLGVNVVHTEAVNIIAQWINSLPNGNGLRGEYWTNQDKTFTGAPTVTRTDPQVNFNWGTGAPATGISSDNFTVRWAGTVQPAVSETYTFYTTTNDGVRLWINNQLLIDKWINQATTEWSSTIALTAGQQYSVNMEYFDNTGGSEASLRWSSPSTPKGIIPMYRLFPASSSGQVFTSLDVTPAAATVVNGGSLRLRAEARDAGGAPLTTQPTITWSVSGGGTISTNGTFTPSTVGGPYIVTGSATVGGTTRTDTSSVTVTAAFATKINFQPATAPTVAGWQVDAGLVFGARGNGLNYGWNADNSSTLRDRNVLTDQLRDTLIHLQKPIVPDAIWEIAVPNGTYQVIAVSGDASHFNSVFRTTAEGTLIINGTPTTGARFVETVIGGATVIVNDGRLTLRSGSGAVNNKLNLVEIVQVPVAIQ